MKVTINFGPELDTAVQEHLENGTPVQQYIRSAVAFFGTALHAERNGNAVGYGDAIRFKQYNCELSPTKFLKDGQ